MPSFASNVISLSKYRQRCQASSENNIIFYVSESARLADLLLKLPGLQVKIILSEEDLARASHQQWPALLVVESGTKWFERFNHPFYFNQESQIPVILIWDSPQKNRNQVKRAYSLGVSDMLFGSPTLTEIQEVIDVWLKFQRQSLLMY